MKKHVRAYIKRKIHKKTKKKDFFGVGIISIFTYNNIRIFYSEKIYIFLNL